MTPRLVAIVPCNDVDAAEAWWNRLGFTRPADQGFDDYRMLADAEGSEVHLQPAVPGWLEAGRNPFGVYLYTSRAADIAAAVPDAVIEPGKAPEHKPWGMWEVSLDGPDGLLVRVGWPSRLVR